MSFKVKILNIDSVLKQIEELFVKDVLNKQTFEEIKDFSVLRIQAETRKGNDLTTGGKQKALSEVTKSFRKDLVGAEINTETDSWWFDPDPVFFKPSKSNLTATGQMLESLRGRVSNLYGTITISPTGTRNPKRQNNNEIKTNAELAKDLGYRGRKFLGLDDIGIRRIRKMILDKIRRFKKSRNFK